MTSNDCKKKIIEIIATIPGTPAKAGIIDMEDKVYPHALLPKSWKRQTKKKYRSLQELSDEECFDNFDDYIKYDGGMKYVEEYTFPCVYRVFLLDETDFTEAVVISDEADENIQCIFFHVD